MKKVVTAFSLLLLISGFNFSVEAGIFSKVTSFVKEKKNRTVDLIKGRKNDDDSKSIEKIANSLKGISAAFASSGNKQFSYVLSNFTKSENDLSFLIAYSFFAKNSELLFHLLEAILSKLRTEYASLLGAQNRSENNNSERKQEKIDNDLELRKSNVNRCLEVLGSNGISALCSNLECSEIVLLKIIQTYPTASQANIKNLSSQVANINNKYILALENISSDLQANIEAIQGTAETQVHINSKMKTLINNISMVHNTLKLINRYLSGRIIDNNEIEQCLSFAKHYNRNKEIETNQPQNNQNYQNNRPPQNLNGGSNNQNNEEEEGEEDDDEEEEEEEYSNQNNNSRNNLNNQQNNRPQLKPYSEEDDEEGEEDTEDEEEEDEGDSGDEGDDESEEE